VRVLAAGPLALAGSAWCGASPASAQVAPQLRHALASWERFPVRATPRPLVLIDGDNVNAPATGFADDADKEAFLEGAFVAPATLPAGPSSAGGIPVISAADALDILRHPPGSGPPATTQLVITNVAFGTGLFQTDRGIRHLPAWTFEFQGVSDPAQVLAVAPGRLFSAQPVAGRGQMVGPAVLGANGRTLTVDFPGAPAGHGPCDASYRISVAESRAAVAVAVHTVPVVHTVPAHGGSSGAVTCAEPAYDRHLATELSAPLGHRVVVDAVSAMPVTVQVSAHHRAGGSPLTKTANIALGTCAAKDVVVQASLPRLTYWASQPVAVGVVVHNIGSQTCTYGGTGGRYPEYMGPCGAFPLEVESPGGAPLWPGPVAYSCPAISATSLAPGAKVTATGTWPKAIVTRSSSRGAPAGTYRVVVDQHITFTITLR
jgi:hypothetical protein